jgi:hypothetical protein
MFHLYENNRHVQRPNYITADFLLLSYSMALRESVSLSEQKLMMPELHAALVALSDRAAKAGEGDAERANRRFLAVLRALDEGTDPPAEDQEAAAEVKRVRTAAGTSKSEVAGQELDYTQFLPRGDYTRSPELSRYFQAVRYAGAAAFFVQASSATGIDASTADRLTAQAVLLARWISEDDALRGRFEKLQDGYAWIFGPPEDLTSADVIKVVAQHPGAPPAEWRKALLAYARSQGRQPAVFGAALDPGRLEPDVSAADALTSWRLLPGSFTPDAAAQQQLVYGSVGKFLGTGTPRSLTTVNGVPVKGFPLAAEIMGLLGSREAQRLLAASEDTRYEGYEKARAEAARQIARPAGLPGEHLQLLAKWLSGATAGDGPQRLETALGFWVLCRHDAVLYAKQSSTATGRGLEPPDPRKSAWLEPATELYQGLRRLSGEIEARLAAPPLGKLGDLLDECIRISRDEEAGRTLRAEQIAFLNGLDRDLLRLTGAPDKPVAVDVHTDVNSGQVLVEALRFPGAVTHGDQRGARFRTTEFKMPMKDRMTDEAWQQKLAAEVRQP